MKNSEYITWEALIFWSSEKESLKNMSAITIFKANFRIQNQCSSHTVSVPNFPSKYFVTIFKKDVVTHLHTWTPYTM